MVHLIFYYITWSRHNLTVITFQFFFLCSSPLRVTETLPQVQKPRWADVDGESDVGSTCGGDGANLWWHVGRFQMQVTANVQFGQSKCSDKMVTYVILSYNWKWNFLKEMSRRNILTFLHFSQLSVRPENGFRDSAQPCFPWRWTTPLALWGEIAVSAPWPCV